MNAQLLLDQLHMDGFRLVVSGDKLRVNPFSRLTPDMRAKLKMHRSEIILALRRCPFCRQHGARSERTVRDGLNYFDTLCAACGELIETYVQALPKQARTEVVA